MSYEQITEKIKLLPKQAFEEVAHYVDYIYMLYTGKSEDSKNISLKSLRGSLSKYANPDLIDKEKSAWAAAAGAKHAVR
ncbi:MAG: hypothetical protein IJ727_11445 [Treponema sp.]|nr:hypothetical protein [Treponema sp.]